MKTYKELLLELFNIDTIKTFETETLTPKYSTTKLEYKFAIDDKPYFIQLVNSKQSLGGAKTRTISITSKKDENVGNKTVNLKVPSSKYITLFGTIIKFYNEYKETKDGLKNELFIFKLPASIIEKTPLFNKIVKKVFMGDAKKGLVLDGAFRAKSFVYLFYKSPHSALEFNSPDVMAARDSGDYRGELYTKIVGGVKSDSDTAPEAIDITNVASSDPEISYGITNVEGINTFPTKEEATSYAILKYGQDQLDTGVTKVLKVGPTIAKMFKVTPGYGVNVDFNSYDVNKLGVAEPNKEKVYERIHLPPEQTIFTSNDVGVNILGLATGGSYKVEYLMKYSDFSEFMKTNNTIENYSEAQLPYVAVITGYSSHALENPIAISCRYDNNTPTSAYGDFGGKPVTKPAAIIPKNVDYLINLSTDPKGELFTVHKKYPIIEVIDYNEYKNNSSKYVDHIGIIKRYSDNPTMGIFQANNGDLVPAVIAFDDELEDSSVTLNSPKGYLYTIHSIINSISKNNIGKQIIPTGEDKPWVIKGINSIRYFLNNNSDKELLKPIRNVDYEYIATIQKGKKTAYIPVQFTMRSFMLLETPDYSVYIKPLNPIKLPDLKLPVSNLTLSAGDEIIDIDLGSDVSIYEMSSKLNDFRGMISKLDSERASEVIRKSIYAINSLDSEYRESVNEQIYKLNETIKFVPKNSPEGKALISYTGSGYVGVSRFVRNFYSLTPKPNEGSNQTALMIQDAFVKYGLKLPNNLILYRGSNIRTNDLIDLISGDNILLNGGAYSSVSSNPSVAHNFTDKTPYSTTLANNVYSASNNERKMSINEKPSIFYSISGLDNCLALPLKKISNYPEEDEFLIDKGTLISKTQEVVKILDSHDKSDIHNGLWYAKVKVSGSKPINILESMTFSNFILKEAMAITEQTLDKINILRVSLEYMKQELEE